MLGNARLFCQTGSVVYPPSPALGGGWQSESLVSAAQSMSASLRKLRCREAPLCTTADAYALYCTLVVSTGRRGWPDRANRRGARSRSSRWARVTSWTPYPCPETYYQDPSGLYFSDLFLVPSA